MEAKTLATVLISPQVVPDDNLRLVLFGQFVRGTLHEAFCPSGEEGIRGGVRWLQASGAFRHTGGLPKQELLAVLNNEKPLVAGCTGSEGLLDADNGRIIAILRLVPG